MANSPTQQPGPRFTVGSAPSGTPPSRPKRAGALLIPAKQKTIAANPAVTLLANLGKKR